MKTNSVLLALFALVFGLGIASVFADEPSSRETREIFADPDFSDGFLVVDGAKSLGVLRVPAPGGGNALKSDSKPSWKLAQHNSRYNLIDGTFFLDERTSGVETPGQRVALENDGSGDLVLSLGVATENEYRIARKSDEPWIHLLLVQDLPPERRVAFDRVDSLVFSCEARVVDWDREMEPEEFNPAIHATQASVYFVIANDNPNSPDYRDYIWFGISFFDDRYEVQTQYVEIDGDPRTIGTGKLIYRLGDQKTIDEVLGGVNPYSKEWTRVELDIASRIDDMLRAGQERGMMKDTKPADLELCHFNYGWETPGTYRSTLEIKNLHLRATYK